MIESKAPIILFVYNRLYHTTRTVEALKKNIFSNQSDLIIISDGPRNKFDIQDVSSLRGYLKTIAGFKSITIKEHKINKGLARSIVSGISEVINEYGHAIILEDDIETSPYFLKFMNEALDLYKDVEEVMSISGYMYPHKKKLPETFFFNVPLCWGWATWKRAWVYYNNNAEYFLNKFTQQNKWKQFNKLGGKYLERQLRNNANGSINTWFVLWHASIFEKGGFCLFPNKTLVINTGFDNSGVHRANTNKYFSEVSLQNIKVKQIELQESTTAKRIIKQFYLLKTPRIMKRLINQLRKI